MSKCAESACVGAKTETLIECSSPFCNRQFHLSCAKLKGKKKTELNNIYFLCNRCIEFVSFSNKSVENKLINLEEKLNNFLQPINLKLNSIEHDLKDAVQNLSDRIVKLENDEISQKKVNTELFVKIDNLSGKIDNELNEMKRKIESINKEMQEFNKNPGPNQETSAKSNTPGNDSLVKYRIRVSGISEAPTHMKFSDRQTYERESLNDVFNFVNAQNVSMSDCFRLGKFKQDSKRPRTILVTFASVWDKNKIIQNCAALKDYKHQIFISPELSASDQVTQRKLLKKRWQLIQSGADRRDVKIKNLKLFNKGDEVNVEMD